MNLDLNRKALINRMGHYKGTVYEPKVTMTNARCPLEGYKAPQHWAVQQWNCVLCNVIELHPVSLGWSVQN